MSDLLHRRDEAMLVRLADGTLAGPARRRAEARLRAMPDGERLIERQRRVTRALAAGAEPAPLHAARPARAVWRPSLRAVAAGALTAVLAALVVLVPHASGPSADRAALLSRLPASEPAPQPAGPVLAAAVDGVAFPDWEPEFGWRATGMRRDDLGGRPAATVFYEHQGHRLAYTIVSGAALPRPAGARIVERNGLRISLYRDPGHGGHDVAVFERGGRTCVVAGHVLEQRTLLDLAAWKGGGRVRS